MVNHIFQKRKDKLEMHFRFGEGDKTEVRMIDFSKIKSVKSLIPLLQENMTLPKMEKKDSDAETKENRKVGVYSIFHPGSKRWLTPNGWGYVQNYFDIVPEKTMTNRLSVLISPRDAVNSGAAWGVKDIKWRESASSVSVPKGNCVVEFRPLEGWVTPKSRQIDIEEGGDEAISAEYTVSRPKLMRNEPLNVLFVFLIAFCLAIVTYYLGKPIGPGSLAAALSPPEVVSQGAKWRIENGNWQTGGESLELEAGEYELEFKPVDGWQSPPQRKIAVKEGQTAQVDVAYNRTPQTNTAPTKEKTENAQGKSEGDTRQQHNGDSLPPDSDSGLKINSDGSDDVGRTTPPEAIISSSENAAATKDRKTPSRPVAMGRSITVQIAPPEAVQAGARWKLEGPGGWKADGEKISGLINIPYTVIFKRIEGWKAPHDLELTTQGPVRIAREAMYEKLSEARTDNQ